MDILSYLMGLKIGKKSEGGGSDAEKYYLYGANDDYITLPVKVTNTLKITIDMYADQDGNMPTNMRPIMRYGEQTTWLYSKRFGALGMYRGNWNNVEIYPGRKQLKVVLDRVNRIMSAIGNNGEVSIDDSNNNWPTNSNNYLLCLGEWVGYNNIKIEDGGTLAYNLIATVDTSGTPCLKDTLSGSYYYANGESAILKTLAA